MELPGEGFVYGLPNRASTPIKDIINGEYGNKAERKLKKNYQSFFEEKSKVKKLVIKKTPHFKKLLESRKLNSQLVEQKQYKLKMFTGIPSKVSQNLKQFKTFKLNKHLSADNIYQPKQPQIQEEQPNFVEEEVVNVDNNLMNGSLDNQQQQPQQPQPQPVEEIPVEKGETSKI